MDGIQIIIDWISFWAKFLLLFYCPSHIISSSSSFYLLYKHFKTLDEVIWDQKISFVFVFCMRRIFLKKIIIIKLSGLLKGYWILLLHNIFCNIFQKDLFKQLMFKWFSFYF